MPQQSLGSTLLRTGLLSRTDHDAIVKNLSPHPAAFAKGVIALGVMTDKALAAVLARETRVPCVDGDLSAQIDRSAIANYDWQLMTMLECVPLKIEQGRLKVAVADPTDRLNIRKLEFCLGVKVSLVIAPVSEIHDCLASIVSNFRPEITPFEKFLADHAEVGGQVETADGDSSRGNQVRGMFDFDAARADESEFVAMDDIAIGTEDIPQEPAAIDLPKIDGDDFQNSADSAMELAPGEDSAGMILANDFAPEQSQPNMSVSDSNMPQLEQEGGLSDAGTELIQDSTELLAEGAVDEALVEAEASPEPLNSTPDQPLAEHALAEHGAGAEEHGATASLDIDLEFADAGLTVEPAPEQVSAKVEPPVAPIEPAQYSQTLAQLNLAAMTVNSAGSNWQEQIKVILEPSFPVWGLFSSEGRLQMGWPDKLKEANEQEFKGLVSSADTVMDIADGLSLKDIGASRYFVTKDMQTILIFSSPAWAANCEKPLRRLVVSLMKRLLRAT